MNRLPDPPAAARSTTSPSMAAARRSLPASPRASATTQPSSSHTVQSQLSQSGSIRRSSSQFDSGSLPLPVNTALGEPPNMAASTVDSSDSDDDWQRPLGVPNQTPKRKRRTSNPKKVAVAISSKLPPATGASSSVLGGGSPSFGGASPLAAASSLLSSLTASFTKQPPSAPSTPTNTARASSRLGTFLSEVTNTNTAQPSSNLPPLPTSSASATATATTSSIATDWVDDSSVTQCQTCSKPFTLFLRKHHCRACGKIFCADCSKWRRKIAGHEELVRVCEKCDAKIARKEDAKSKSTEEVLIPLSKNASPEPSTSSLNTLTSLPLIAALTTELECYRALSKHETLLRDELLAIIDTMTRQYRAALDELEHSRHRIHQLEQERDDADDDAHDSHSD